MGKTFWSVTDWLGTMQTSITCFLAANLTNIFRTRPTISSHHCKLLLHNDRVNWLQFNETSAHTFIHYFTVALDRNAYRMYQGLKFTAPLQNRQTVQSLFCWPEEKIIRCILLLKWNIESCYLSCYLHDHWSITFAVFQHEHHWVTAI